MSASPASRCGPDHSLLPATSLPSATPVYGSGKALASGLGEAVMDRALADVHWLRERLDDVEQGRPLRAKAWGQAAFARANLHVCWAITGDRRSAFELERAVLIALNHGDLWNRAHPASST